jgi:anthranilate synthase/aminodeoxychorismate synthase-like glutamine amidotransferase
VFGGDVVRAGRLMHGKTSPIYHNGDPLFEGMPNPFNATRYHSLLIKRETIPDALQIIAETRPEGEIMGVRHKTLPIWGVQFHPESILTENGKQILANFLKLSA